MKLAEKEIIIERRGVQMKYTIRELILVNGPTNPVIMSIIGNVLVGIPVAFSTNREELIFSAEDVNNGFLRGHEIGHVNLGHLDGIEKGVLVDINKEVAADHYAIANDYCSLIDAIDCLTAIRDKIKSGPLGWFKRIILFKTYKQLSKRIQILLNVES